MPKLVCPWKIWLNDSLSVPIQGSGLKQLLLLRPVNQRQECSILNLDREAGGGPGCRGPQHGGIPGCRRPLSAGTQSAKSSSSGSDRPGSALPSCPPATLPPSAVSGALIASDSHVDPPLTTLREIPESSQVSHSSRSPGSGTGPGVAPNLLSAPAVPAHPTCSLQCPIRHHPHPSPCTLRLPPAAPGHTSPTPLVLGSPS